VKVAEVLWEDAWIDTNDISIKKAIKLSPVIRSTIGYLITEKEDCIVLSTDYFEKGKEVSAPMVIPTGMIIEWWVYD
jgi:hypothetical protein